MAKKAAKWNPDEWIQATEAAKMIGRHRVSITHYVNCGKMLSCRKYGRLFVARRDVENFVPPKRGNPMLFR